MLSSTALFGSAARGDKDEFSDNDCLVVGNDRGSVFRCRCPSPQGFSCSTYTWRKLNYIANDGSLFVAHLRKEAVILNDPLRRLRTLLDNYRPHRSYETLKQDAFSLVRLLSAVPACPEGAGWAIDVLFTAFRTYAVPYLAEQGEFKFAYNELVDAVLIQRSELEEFRDDFLELRKGKSLYRRGEFHCLPTGKISVERSFLGLTRLLRLQVPMKRCDLRECLLQTLSELRLPQRCGYLNLRTLECASVAAGAVGTKLSALQLAPLQRQVLAPAAYAFDAYPGRSGHTRACES